MLKRMTIDNNYIFIVSSFDINNLKKVLSNKDIVSLFKEPIDIDKYLIELLHNLGVSSNMKGYNYIKDIVLYLYENDIKCNLCNIYKIIADRYDSKMPNIERSIAKAIEKSFNRADIEYVEKLFGFSVDPEKAIPTNKEYICTILDKLRTDFEKY